MPKMTTNDWNKMVMNAVRKSCLAMAWVPAKNCSLGSRVRRIIKDLDRVFNKSMQSGFNPTMFVYLVPATPGDLQKLKDLTVQRRKEVKKSKEDEYQHVRLLHTREGMADIKYSIIDGAHRCTWLQRREGRADEEDKKEWALEMNHVQAYLMDPHDLDSIKLAHAINQVTHSVVPLGECGDLQSMSMYVNVSNFDLQTMSVNNQ